MPMRFISVWLAVASLSACASLPFTGKPDQPAVADTLASGEAREAHAARASQRHSQQVPVNTPPVKAANQALFDQAKSLFAAGELSAAAMTFEKITLSQPELAGPWVNLGLIRDRQDDAAGAEAAWLQALQANPGNCDALNLLGVRARRQGDFSQAERYYRQCLDVQPEYHAASLNLGILYELYMGRYGEALAAYQDYQLAVQEPDAKVNGWVIDLERRVAALAQR